jgi:hypothetical protein
MLVIETLRQLFCYQQWFARGKDAHGCFGSILCDGLLKTPVSTAVAGQHTSMPGYPGSVLL